MPPTGVQSRKFSVLGREHLNCNDFIYCLLSIGTIALRIHIYCMSHSQTGTFELIDITDSKGGTYECIFYLSDDQKVSTEIKIAPRSKFSRAFRHF